MSIRNLIDQRTAAGARYASAVAEFREAFLELAALDGALVGKTSEQVRSFGTYPDMIALRHPVYAPDLEGHWPTEATERRNEFLAQLD
ncbi:hypothetical protein [Tardiphaga sp.]|uniref:hypothetical protein n=1 Tax=Tardiphaga sp. TaxID=1926292 RepID=UPI00262F6521|nr:hypothetical protein [Tardiphaga sp.]MDB5617471.1 hypothetical protein [Tardiphaga sp.]